MGKHEAVETKDGLQNRSVRRNARLAVGVGLSAALLATPLTSVMAEENESSGDSVAIDVSTSWVGEVGEKVELQVLANGEKVDEVTLTEETGWDYTFEVLPTTQEKQPVAYSVTEKALDGYETEISGDAETGFTVRNIDEDAPDVDLSAFYESIEIGMTYDEVVALIGVDGQPDGVSDTGIQMVGWNAANGDMLSLGFDSDDEVVLKRYTAAATNNDPVEVELPDEPAPDVDLQAIFDSLEIGMPYDEALGLIQFEGEADGEATDGVQLLRWTAANGDSMVLGFNSDSEGHELVEKRFVAADADESPVDDEPTDDKDPVTPPTDDDQPVEDPPEDTKPVEADDDPVVETPKEKEPNIPAPVETPDEPITDEPTVDKPVVQTPTDKATPVVTPAESESEYVAMYKALAFGISYEEAVMITGTEGTIVTDNEATLNGETVLDLDQYSWTNADGDVLLLGFMDDQLVSKSLTADGNSMMEYDYESYTEPDGDEPIAESATPVSANGEKTAESQDNEKGSPKAEANESKESAAADKVTEGKKLADTATNTFNLLALGVGLLVAAGGGLFVMNRRKQANE